MTRTLCKNVMPPLLNILFFRISLLHFLFYFPSIGLPSIHFSSSIFLELANNCALISACPISLSFSYSLPPPSVVLLWCIIVPTLVAFAMWSNHGNLLPVKEAYLFISWNHQVVKLTSSSKLPPAPIPSIFLLIQFWWIFTNFSWIGWQLVHSGAWSISGSHRITFHSIWRTSWSWSCCSVPMVT